ncbi:NAD(P)/FAD-dependent oxidoreductase [Sporolactobacillus vineae]|uniref:NAD(P)/FAD-dependent oxidoreductase n=1 Tax=Sporolactobacillus vineae TaxID=444463 RepID=UPI000288ADA1|nr:NAD(P)/FAD-dependent oxidoreductase [Sporolactobacillus vineae]
MRQKTDKFDVIVIGAGPAGLMASIAAAENEAKVLVLDKGDRPGRKLAISGGGRCNVTNAMATEELIRHIPGNGRFLYSALSEFSNQDIISFFKKLGIPLKEEDHGRMFPVNNRAQSVVQALLQELNRLEITLKLNTPVDRVLYEDRITGVRTQTGEIIHAPSVIIAVGGKSVPQTGSTGDGYRWAQDAGHTITDLYPTEVPLTSSDSLIVSKELQGLSLRDATVTLLSPKGKKIQSHRWDLIFTHFGLSGPAILRLSQFVVKALRKYNTATVTVLIDALPDRTLDEVSADLLKRTESAGKKELGSIWKGIVPERYLRCLMNRADVSPTLTVSQLSKEKVRSVAEGLKAFPVRINGTLPIEKAFITGGGVSLKEIHPKTMASRIMPGLYFCGEILDIHGYTGGYNITAAFTTGHAAGTAAGLYAGGQRN